MKKLLPASAQLIPIHAVCVFKGPIFEVYHWQQPLFDGKSQTFEMLKRSDTAAVIAVVDNKIMVTENEQPYSGKKKTFPGGRVDIIDDSVEEVARRETKEETGYTFNNWKLVNVVQPVAKIEWFVNTFIAWDVQNMVQPVSDPGEKVAINLVELTELKRMIDVKEGYLGSASDLFKNINSIDDLIKLPDYNGQLVDR